MTEPSPGDRRVMRLRVSFAFLSEMIKGHMVRTGERITSNLPDDANIVHVVEMPEDVIRGGGVLTFLVESNHFPACPNGAVPPEFVATFTRSRLRAPKP